MTVHDLRIPKYEDQQYRLRSEISDYLNEVDFTTNTPEFLTSVRTDACKKWEPEPRVGAFEVHLRYWIETEVPPKKEGDPPTRRSFEKRLRLFSKLKTKKWPIIPKIVTCVRNFLPIKFDLEAKHKLEQEAQERAESMANAKAAVSEASMLIEQQKLAIAEAEAKVEELRPVAAEQQGKLEELLAQRSESDAGIEKANLKVRDALNEQRELSSLAQAADAEAAAADPGEREKLLTKAEKLRNDFEKAESLANKYKREARNFEEAADELVSPESLSSAQTAAGDANRALKDAMDDVEKAKKQLEQYFTDLENRIQEEKQLL
eukprot:gene17577-20929_t